jgi:hypothetical protein
MRTHVVIGTTVVAIVGAIIGAAATWYLIRAHSELSGRIFHVREIDNYGEADGNLLATFQVFLEGRSGHVTKVRCLLPPDTKLTEVQPNSSSDNPYERLFTEMALVGVTQIEITSSAASEERDLYYCRIVAATA